MLLYQAIFPGLPLSMENPAEKEGDKLDFSREEILNLKEVHSFLQELQSREPGRFEVMEALFVSDTPVRGFIKINYKDQQPGSYDYYIFQQVFVAEKHPDHLQVTYEKYYTLYAFLQGRYYVVDEHGHLVEQKNPNGGEW